jgi:prephenate dehydrogenase
VDIARNLLSEDNQLLSEILFNPHSLLELDRITSRLEFLKHIVRGRDYEELAQVLEGLRGNINGRSCAR